MEALGTRLYVNNFVLTTRPPDPIFYLRSIQKLTKSDEQFKCFIRIVDQYLRSTSPQEVNLGSKTQERLLPFQTRREWRGVSVTNKYYMAPKYKLNGGITDPNYYCTANLFTMHPSTEYHQPVS